MMLAAGCDEEMAETIFDTYDADGSGDVDLDEFLGLFALSVNGSEEDKIRASFNAFDKDKDGVLSKEEFRNKLRAILRQAKYGGAITPEESKTIDAEVDKVLNDIFDLVDTDKNGSIDREEFVHGLSANPQVLEFIKDLRG